MVKMVPEHISPATKSEAEKDVFLDFQRYPTDSHYIILHSLGMAEHNSKIVGETDFVIICSSGVLCVEVKGGTVGCHDGVWEFTNRYGMKSCKTEGPFRQVQENMFSLRNYLQKQLGEKSPLVRCQYACCVIMPQCSFTYRGIEVIPEVLFDRDSGHDLDMVARHSFEYWGEKFRNRYNFALPGLTDEEMKELAGFLRGDFHFEPSLKDLIDVASSALHALTAEQYSVLESLEDNKRILVSGVAGSGKTWLGMEQARRKCRTGSRVLYVCFNRCISEYISYRFKAEGLDIDARTLHAVMLQGKAPDESSPEYFEKVLPARFLQSVPEGEYDYLVVDEGQDLLREEYFLCLEKLVRGGWKDGNWSIFYDPNQNLYNSDGQLDSFVSELKKYSAAMFRLSVNCRNTKQIANAITLMTEISQSGRPGAWGPEVQYFSWTDREDEHRILDELLMKLKEEGITGGDIIILSRYSLKNTNCCLYNSPVTREAGTMKTDGQMWCAGPTEIRFSTIAGFKGLESKVVILTDVDGFKDENMKFLNYVGASRACALLCVLYDRGKEDERQEVLRRVAINPEFWSSSQPRGNS